MSTCPSCQRPATKRDGSDAAGRQRYPCRPCRRDFTAFSSPTFSGYRWPPDVILMAVRWYCNLPLSAAQVVRLLAERNIDVSARTVLNWIQTFGPQLAAALRTYRRRVGRTWTVDEVFCFRGTQKLYVYRVVDEYGQVIDVLLRNKRDQASAEAFFRRALAWTEVLPKVVITDHHQPYVKAVVTVIPLARHVRDCIAAAGTPPSPSSAAMSPSVTVSEAHGGSELFTRASGLWKASKPCTQCAEAR